MKNSKPKALVIISPGFPANEADCTCIPPQQIFVRSLKEVNPELNIIVLTLQYPFFSREYHWHGIKVISFGGENKGKVFRFFTGTRVWMSLRKLNKEYQLIGLLSFWFGKSSYIAHLFAKEYHLPHYSWLLGQDAKAGNKYFNKIKPTGESLIALSDFIAREFNKNYGVLPQHIVPVGIDTLLFSTAAIKRDIDIFGAGSLIPLKQYAVFIEVVNSLKEHFPHIKTVICGDGPEMKKLREMVNVMNLEANVSFTGRLPHTKVLEYMQRSKIFLHTSNYEGFGAVCLEALYAGADVVSFVKPMDAPIKNWHIATDKQDMLQLLKGIMLDPDKDYQSVLPYSTAYIATAMLKLFDQRFIAIS